jgi:AcrR family transcriptional regulator
VGQLKHKARRPAVQRPKKRARRPEAKAERRRALLAAAANLFAHTPYHEVRVADVAKKAGIAKPTVFLYFASKEALFLALLEERLAVWLSEREVELQALSKLTADDLAERLSRAVLAARDLVRLLSLLSTVLESPVEVDTVAAFKLALLGRLVQTGTLVESRADLAPGEGARLLLRTYAVVIGLLQLAEPGPAARVALTRPELSPLVIDLDHELPLLLRALVRGLSSLA